MRSKSLNHIRHGHFVSTIRFSPLNREISILIGSFKTKKIPQDESVPSVARLFHYSFVAKCFVFDPLWAGYWSI